MSKYLTLFNTEAQWQAAQDTLDYPNVSLIDTTGDLHYSKYVGQEVANAPFGSILMAEVATNKLFYILNSEYNLTDYPLANYKPIAVCIYDKASNANNEAVFMSVQLMDYKTLGQGNPKSIGMKWGFYNIDLSDKVPELFNTGSNHVSSTIINEAMKPLVTVDYSGTSIPNNSGDGESPAFCCCWRFKTPGTNEGDWYFPSYYDVMKYQQNYSTINEVLTNIKTVAGTSYLDTINGNQRICTMREVNYAYVLQGDGIIQGYFKVNNDIMVRAVFIARLKEI